MRSIRICNNKFLPMLAFAIFTLLGCQPRNKAIDSPQQSEQPLAPQPSSEQASGQKAKSSDSTQSVIVVSDDDAVLPQPITGAYLYCSDDHNPTSMQDPRDYSVRCALLEKDSHVPAPVYELGYTVSWSLLGIEESLLSKASGQELREHRQWHYELNFPAISQAEINQLKLLATFGLQLQNDSGMVAQASTPIRSNAYSWVALNGGTIPANGILAGTEQQAAVPLFICRLHYEGGIYPGKLRDHYADPANSICYTTVDGTSLESQASDPAVNQYANDVLLLDDPQLAERIRWLPASNGTIPFGAFAGGIDAQGRILYLCRNLEGGAAGDSAVPDNDPNGEWTPGYIRAGDNVCRHEFFGSKALSTYEVLSIGF